MSAATFQSGDLVRLVQKRGFVKKAEAGRLMTVRDVRPCPYSGRIEARVDDGDPANDDLHTNGMALAMWVPLDAIEPLRRSP